MVSEPERLPLGDSELKLIARTFRRTGVAVTLAVLMAIALTLNVRDGAPEPDFTGSAASTVYRAYPSSAVTDLTCLPLGESASRCSYMFDSERCNAIVSDQTFEPRCRLH